MDPTQSTSSVQLDPQEMRNLAISLGNNAPPPPPAISAPASLPSPAMPPGLGISTPQPHVVAPRGTIEGDSAERTRELSTGAGVDQIYGKVTGSHFGQQHPVLSKILGGLGEGVAKLGDIGLSAIAPALAINLPGTEYHHQMQLNQLNRQIGAETGEQEKQAQTANQQSEIPMHQAETEHEQAATQGLLNPLPKDAQEAFAKIYQHEHPDSSIEEATQAYTDATTKDKQQTPEEATYSVLTKGGAKPLDALSQIYGAKGEKSVPLSQQYLDALQKGDQSKAGLIKQAIKETETQPKIDVHTAEDKGVPMLQPDGKGGYTLQYVHGGQSVGAGAVTPGGLTAQGNASRADVREHDKAYVLPAETKEQSYRMADQAYREYETARQQGKELPTGAQSMLMLSQHLATTFGNVKGARVTKDMIAEHLGARSISDDALTAFQKFTNGDKLSPQQWAAFHQLIQQSRNEAWSTAVREAARKQIPINFLPPDLQTISKEGHQYDMGPDGQYHLKGGQ